MTNEEESTQESSGRGDAAPSLLMASSALRPTTTREEVITWLLSPPDSRTSHQVAAIVAMLSHFPKLRSTGETALTALARQITACQPSRGDVVIKSGESPDCLYMILDGVVVLLESNQHNYSSNHHGNGRGNAARRRSSNGGNRGGGRQSESRDGKPDDVLTRCVEWELLGDEAILAGMRVPCRAQVESARALLLVVPRHLFHETISQSVRAAFNRKIDFLARLPVFSNMPRRVVEKLAPFFYEMELRPKELLCRQGDAADCMWAVVSGRCHVVIDPHWSPAANRSPETDSKRTSQVAAIQSGGLIGEMCVFGAVRHRAATVRAATDAVVYRLKRLHFLRICPPAQLEELRAIAEAKMLLLVQAEREEAGVASRLSRVLRGHCLRALYPSHRAHLLRGGLNAALPLPSPSIRPLSTSAAAATSPGSGRNAARSVVEATMSIRSPEQELSYEVDFETESSYNSQATKSDVLDLDSDTTHSSWVHLTASAVSWARSPAMQATAPPVGRPPPPLPVAASAAARLDAVLSQLVDPGEDWKPDGAQDDGDQPPHNRHLHSNLSGRSRMGGPMGAGSDGGLLSREASRGGLGQLRRKSLPALMATRVPPAPTSIAALPFGWGYTFLRPSWDVGGNVAGTDAHGTDPAVNKQPHVNDAGERPVKALTTSSGVTGTGPEQAPAPVFLGRQQELHGGGDVMATSAVEKGEGGKGVSIRSGRESSGGGGGGGSGGTSGDESNEGAEGLLGEVGAEGLEGAGAGQERQGDGDDSDSEAMTSQLLTQIPKQLLPLVDFSWNFGPCSILKVLYASSTSGSGHKTNVGAGGSGECGGEGDCSTGGGSGAGARHQPAANAVDSVSVPSGAAAKRTSGQVRRILRNNTRGSSDTAIFLTAVSTKGGPQKVHANSASGDDYEDAANTTPKGGTDTAITLPLRRRSTTPDNLEPWSYRDRNSGGSTVVGFGRGMSFCNRQSGVVPGPPVLSLSGGKGSVGEAAINERHSLPQLRPQQGLPQPHLSAQMPHRGTRGRHGSMVAAASAAAAAVACVGPGTSSAPLFCVRKMPSEPYQLRSSESDSAAVATAPSPTSRCGSPAQGARPPLLSAISVVVSRCSSPDGTRGDSALLAAAASKRQGGVGTPPEPPSAGVTADEEDASASTTMAQKISGEGTLETLPGAEDGAANTSITSASEAVNNNESVVINSTSTPRSRTGAMGANDDLGSPKVEAGEGKMDKAAAARATLLPRPSEDSVASHTSDDEEAPAPCPKEGAASAVSEGAVHRTPEAPPARTRDGDGSSAAQRPLNGSGEQRQDGVTVTTNASTAAAAVSTSAGSGTASKESSKSEVESAGAKDKGQQAKDRLPQPSSSQVDVAKVDNNQLEAPSVQDPEPLSPQISQSQQLEQPQHEQQEQEQEYSTVQLQICSPQHPTRQTQQHEQQLLQEHFKKNLLTFDWHAAQTTTPWVVVRLSQAPSLPSSQESTSLSPGRGSGVVVRASSGGALMPLGSYPHHHLQSSSRSGPASPVPGDAPVGSGCSTHLPVLRGSGRPISPVSRRSGVPAYAPVAQSLAVNRAVLATAASLASAAICPSAHGMPPGFNPSSSTGNALAALLAPGGGRTSLPVNVRQPNMIVKGGLVYRAAGRQRTGEVLAGSGGGAGGRGSTSGVGGSLMGSASGMIGSTASLQG